MAEQWHPVKALAARFAFSPKHIRTLIKDGAFGDTVLMVGSDLRVPDSGVRAFEEQHSRRVSFRGGFSRLEAVSR